MKFHLPLLPYPPSPACAYAGKQLRFAEMMRARGHEVVEHVPPVIDETRAFDPDSKAWRAANHSAAAAILADHEPADIVCLVAGRCQQQLADALQHLSVVEAFVGYGGVLDNVPRVFESAAWMHTVYGSRGGLDPHSVDGRFLDAVIPNYYDPDEFPAGDGDGDEHGRYHLFMGRLIDRKGYQIAADVCERLGIRLVLAGEGTPPTYGEHVGLVDHVRRAELMGAAEAVWAPTVYIEPFGGVAAEAQLCGTPVITSPFGAYVETVEHGVTGFRCHTFGEFLDAASDGLRWLDRRAIRERALRLWTLDAVAPQYERFFERVADLHHHHWGDPERRTS